MKRAFTLIELLVVIAIIAILAAILFPVFAQAKEAAKKTAALSQAKQVGTATIMYAGDNDDLFPTGNVPNVAGSTNGAKYYLNWQALNPVGWSPDDPAGNVQAEDQLVWHNTINPYTKNNDLIISQGVQQVKITGWDSKYSNALKTPKGGNLTFNGLLQNYSSTSVENPSKLPLYWQGQGDLQRLGLAMANPRLTCNGTGPCVFNPSAMPQAGATGTQGATWTLYDVKFGFYNNANNIYVSTDSSARTVNYRGGNAQAFPASCNSLVPFTPVLANGHLSFPVSIRGSIASSTATAAYPCAFRPDNSFSN